jgi:hypothetical protein
VVKATRVTAWSPRLFRLAAWKIPSGIAIRTAIAMPMPDRYALRSHRSPNNAATDWFSL